MMDALSTAMARSSALEASVHTEAVRTKQAGVQLMSGGGGAMQQSQEMQSQTRDTRRYDAYTGWTYSAVHASAEKAAGQSLFVARMTNAEPTDDQERRGLAQQKAFLCQKMTRIPRDKSANQMLELVPDHPLVDLLERPNPIQDKWQFVYSFVANLILTGRAYIVAGENADGKLEVFSLPTTWVTPIHKEGPFAQFRVRDPSNPTLEGVLLDRSQVGIAQLPNPANPMLALAPAASQARAILIDNHIQTSQSVFFEQGIFPTAVITIGSNPHPEVGGGASRPRLSQAQYRQVSAAIRKRWQGVANYGSPAIIDGMVESIDRLSATQNEMGWDKSEDKARTRILSAFGVHPFILGENVKAGGYAQTTTIMARFCDRVNTYINMLSGTVTNLVAPLVAPDERILVWWEKCEATDRSLRSKTVLEARKNGDITKNELRIELGFPPDLEVAEARSRLQETVGGMAATNNTLTLMGQGTISPDTAAWMLSTFLRLPIEEVRAGIGRTNPAAVEVLAEQVRELIRAVQEPVRLEGTDEHAMKLLELAIDVSDGATSKAERTDFSLQEMGREVEKLRADTKRQQLVQLHQLEEMKSATLYGIQSTSRELENTWNLVRDAMSEEDKEKERDRLEQVFSGMKQSLDVIQQSVSQPIEINVSNEVTPTPIEVKNEVEVPTTNVTVMGIQGKQGGRGDKGDVGSKGAKGQAGERGDKGDGGLQGSQGPQGERGDVPDITVNPSIHVDVPTVDVNVKLEKDPCPKTAVITHPDNRTSQITLGEQNGDD